MLFVRALAFGLAPERFFVLALADAVELFVEGEALIRFEVSPFAPPTDFAGFFFGVALTALEDSAIFWRPLDVAERSAAMSALRALIAATRAFVAREARAVLLLRSSVCPGKIIGFRRPLMRIRRSGVVEYFVAIPRIVSPRRTVWTFNLAVLFGNFSIAGSGTERRAAATAGVGTSNTCPTASRPLLRRCIDGLKPFRALTPIPCSRARRSAVSPFFVSTERVATRSASGNAANALSKPRAVPVGTRTW